MGTWVAAIVETSARTDFWDLARKHGVEATTPWVPAFALIDCGSAHGASFRLAESLSRSLGTMALGFAIQTTSDVHEMHAFARGDCIRRLGYDREQDGWVQIEGTPQPWERVYFFDDGSTDDQGAWPDMLADDTSDEDLSRYRHAKRTGDPTSVMALLHPSSMSPMRRVCEFFEINPDEPSGRWRRPSLWSRLFGPST